MVLSHRPVSVVLTLRLLAAGCCLLFLVSCSGHDLPGAREAFYKGEYRHALEKVGTEKIDGKDSVLVLMERGTIYQAVGDFEKSSSDFIQANDIITLLETYSVSEGVSSWVANDTVYSFEGEPYEQTLLHSMAALNHLALDNWDDAGVEARRIIHSLRPDERGEEYPDDPFSRYLAAFILEMTGDSSNAAVQYGLANDLLPDIQIDKRGRIGAASVAGQAVDTGQQQELVCFVLLGHSPTGMEMRGQFDMTFYQPVIRIYAENKYLGDATVLTSISRLAFTTWNLESSARIAKMAARIAAKEAMARSLEDQDALLGALTRIILIGMLEGPDLRRWETLPRWLAVARIPYSGELTALEVRFSGTVPGIGENIRVQRPLVKRGNILFTFVRDLPGFNSKKIPSAAYTQ